MARAYGTRPSSFLGLDDPLAAYSFDHAVWCLEEAIDGAIDRERARLDMAELDPEGRKKVRAAEAAMRRLLNRILGVAEHRREKAAAVAARQVEYVWNADRSAITGFRYVDEEPVSR